MAASRPSIPAHPMSPAASPADRRLPDDPYVISYLSLRKAVGVLGVALPVVLALGGVGIFGEGLQRSISAYYYTGMRDVLVGTLCAIGVFLWSYKGPEPRDDRVGDLACVGAVGAALFPTVPPLDPAPLDRIVAGFHFGFAALFFLALAYFSLVLFTKTHPDRPPTPRKLQRNVVYRVCGWLILAALALVALYLLVPGAERFDGLNPIFWLEAVAVEAFGVSWLVKGEAILEDRPPAPGALGG